MPLIHINNEFKFGDIVSLLCDTEGAKGMVSYVAKELGGAVFYGVKWGDRQESSHYAIELRLAGVLENDFIEDQ